MATSTDVTSFRILSEDGEVIDRTEFPMPGRNIEGFEQYVEASVLDQGETAQWYIYGGGEVLAEMSEAAGLVAYPAANIFN